MNDDLLKPPRAARPMALRRLGLVAFNYGYRLVAGLIVASPFAALMQGQVSGWPRGDATLFDPGGVMLFEALRLAGRSVAGANAGAESALIFTTFLGLLPFAALVAGLGREGRLSASYLAARAVKPIGTLALIWGAAALGQAVVAVLIALLGAKLVDALHLGTPGEDLGRAGLVAVVMVAVLAVGVVRDLAAVSAVNDGTRFYTSAQRALRVVGRAGGRVAIAYAARGAIALIAVVGAVAAVVSLAGGPIAIPLVIHQAAIFVVVLMQASWLAAAIGLVEHAAPLAQPSAPPPLTVEDPAPAPVSAPPPAPISEPPAPASTPPAPAEPPAAPIAAESIAAESIAAEPPPAAPEPIATPEIEADDRKPEA